MVDSLRAKLPPIYGPLFSKFFDRPEIVEPRATCDTCAMCDHGQAAPVAMEFFNPDTKCCTFHPGIANYLVGAVLADQTDELAEGRRRLRAKIAARVGVTPQLIAAPRKYSLVYAAARESGVFGRSQAMRCPYYDAESGGKCTVWRYREAACSTFFCKYAAGKIGWAFWDALKSYLAHVEKMLAHYAAMSVDSNVTEPTVERFHLTLEDVEDRAPKTADYAGYWGKWVGREEEFYVACHERVRALGRSEFEKHVDATPDGRRLLESLERLYGGAVSPAIPERLLANPKAKTVKAEADVVVTTYNPFDALALDRDLYEALSLFDPAETVEENLARLERDHGLALTTDLLQYLYMHGVLVAPEGATKTGEK
ncbi:MAG: hypothetical protein KF819_37910 [Labilithrix sp.]|nr:hypothetical protein [Labilithrix sp.]